jgi:hypothetical protein
METSLDAEFSAIRQRRADAGLGWLASASDALPAPLDVMNLGEFEPDVWIPSLHPAAPRKVIGLDELAHMDVVHGSRRVARVIALGPGSERHDQTLPQAPTPMTWFPSASSSIRWPPRWAWCGAVICRASCSRCFSTPPMASLFDPDC